MPILRDLSDITTHVRTAYAGRGHLLLFATDMGRVTLAGIGFRLLAEGADPALITTGKFEVRSHDGALSLVVGFLTIPAARVNRTALATHLADAAVLMAGTYPGLAPDQDIVLLSPQPEAVLEALSVIVGQDATPAPIAPPRASYASPAPLAV